MNAAICGRRGKSEIWCNGRLSFGWLLYYDAVESQEIVDRFAELAKPRIATLLRLKDARHVYDPTPGEVNSPVALEDGTIVTLSRTRKASQPYRSIERFIPEDRVMQFIIDPGLLPLMTSMSKDMWGRRILVTRRISTNPAGKGVVAHVDGFGMRIRMFFDQEANDTIVTWECLYGVL
jgi:hypothetical protein